MKSLMVTYIRRDENIATVLHKKDSPSATTAPNFARIFLIRQEKIILFENSI